MNKVILLLAFLSLMTLGLVSASDNCALSVSLLNQDPYPATPGEYVKLVFQVDGIQDSNCGDVQFELVEKYPIIFDPNATKKVSLKSGTFVRDYSSHLIVPFKVRVDDLALNGENPIEVRFSSIDQSSNSFLSKEFNLSIKEIQADFEIYVKDYDFTNDLINLEILNIGKSSVSAVTLEIPSSNVSVKGSSTKIVGDLDSNEYTSADFEVSPIAGNIPIKIHYTDSAGIRRTTTTSVFFNPDSFSNRKADQKSTSKTPGIIGILVLAIVVYFWYKRKKKKL
jgi:hypothetical protein